MDFFKRFVSADGGGGGGGGSGQIMIKGNLDEENIELSLGLSLNGKFGTERRRIEDSNNNKNILARANSVVDFTLREGPTTSLMRTCSLPLEMEEEWKKRKELQSIRRSEAKRKRVEKLKNGNCEIIKKRCLVTPAVAPLPPRPVGSPASGGSSGVSDLDSQPISGMNKDIDSKSTNSQESLSQQITSSSLYRSNSVASKPASEKFTMTPSQTTNRNHSKDETLKMMLSDMPCVSTKGDGANGNKIEGFLYRYRKGEEVRIVCVCHGSFLTPAEFVKHGGGGDVEHPLRHIVVNPPSL